MNKKFDEISKELGVSERAFRRVLKDKGINTRLKRRYQILNENYFESIDSQNKAYFLGLIFADGHVGKNNNFIISFKAGRDEIEILNILKKEIGFTGELNFFIENERAFNPNSEKVKLNFSNKKINSDLKKWGLGQHKLESRMNLPKIEKYLLPHFIRGVFDGMEALMGMEALVFIRKFTKWQTKRKGSNVVIRESAIS